MQAETILPAGTDVDRIMITFSRTAPESPQPSYPGVQASGQRHVVAVFSGGGDAIDGCAVGRRSVRCVASDRDHRIMDSECIALRTGLTRLPEWSYASVFGVVFRRDRVPDGAAEPRANGG